MAKSMQIKLTQGYFAIIDCDEYEKVSQYTWRVDKCKNRRQIYAINSKYNIRMHQLIMGSQKGQIVDHINGDGLDNRKLNLRICTKADNARWCRQNKKNTSGFRGVVYHSRRKNGGHNWMAGITVNKKYTYIGIFRTKEDAAIAYNKKALEFFGEFAVLNEV